MAEVKLLTEAEVTSIRAMAYNANDGERIDSLLRERGLIAQEPVDAIRALAQTIKDYLNPQGDEEDVAHVEWLIRNTGELAPAASPLTRESLADACYRAFGWPHSDSDIDRLHAALTEGQSK